MPTATLSLPDLTTDQIDDLLYLARLGDTADLQTAIDLLAQTLSTTPSTVLAAAVDKDTGNGLLHMAAANGHTGSSIYTLTHTHAHTHTHTHTHTLISFLLFLSFS